MLLVCATDTRLLLCSAQSNNCYHCTLSQQSQFSNETDLKRAYDKHDADASGSLDAEELSVLCKEMGAVLSRSELEAALLMLDTNDNGKIEYDEFAGWWRAYQGGVLREGTARSPRAR
jgi:hypothetical protein